jgi:AcrR family transcriptional regulator
MIADNKPKTRGKVGRPRANPSVGSDDPGEDILDAAAMLFCSIGYRTTTTRQIADAAGLRQGSLFHYFARKDDILAELLDRTVTPALEFVAWLDAVGAPPDVALTTLIRADTANLCSLPHNLGTLILLPESRGEQFSAFAQKREALRERYRSLVRLAAVDRRLVIKDVDVTTNLVFGLVESVITWHPSRVGRDAGDVAAALAELVLRALLPRRDRIESLMSQSSSLLLKAAGADPAPPARSRRGR